ncbi:LysR family transcriptional regulator [Nitrobacter winogradskyi]|uniref:DNA-binding transcriptional LysR family regulator n=2 Tax=Nitrobacter winogradskyi TaxID=913 RepID=A0ACC6AIL9_NITWI|nr:LysR family transcriptional regulator [Nitrobacter winogradskyi]MCP1999697.1 DNA-binding transcriptional LysR family regulator [Nitrobacter winogradskyi]GEC15803.1 LysR family transcriptional regulator [Nitrobacter winogradskyi]
MGSKSRRDVKSRRNELTIELRHLRYFIAAAEHGSFRKAGVARGVQESAISRRVRDLEDELGASLFNRYNGGVRLTFAGERFLSRARQIIRNVGHGAEDVASIGRSEDGRVRVGIYSSIASGFLAELLRMYEDKHRSVDVEMIEGNPSEHVAAIREFKLDVAFLRGSRAWADCETVYLWSERAFAVLPDNHALAKREEIQWQDLTGQAFIVSDSAPGQEIYDYLVLRMADLGRHPDIRVQYVGRDNLLPLVALGRGLTVVSEAMTAALFPGLCYRPIAGEILRFNAVWSPKNDNPAFRRFLSLARSIAASRKPDGIKLPSSTIVGSGGLSRKRDRLP